VDERVRFHGNVDDMAGFWAEADVCVVPTNRMREAFGMVAAEGLAAGCPVVAARAGALPEIVQDGKCGLLYEPGNSDELAACMMEYLEDWEMYVTHSAAARERAWTFDVGRMVNEYVRVMRECCHPRAEEGG
jgi:glycosyltransferase involved in cell wall biosynthesis